jgi:Flp pilus assembly protein TadD
MKTFTFLRWFTLATLILAGLTACVSAEKKLESAREKDPQYQCDKASLCMQYNMVDEALKYLDVALSLNPRHAPSLNLQGLAFLMKGRFPEAVKSLESCLLVDPAFSEAWNNLATAYDQNNQKEKAAEAWTKAFNLDGNYNAAYNLAKSGYENNRFETALDWIQKAILKFPKSKMAFNLQGLIFESLERPTEAIDSYLQAMRLDPSELNIQFNLAAAYYKNKNYDRARDLLEKILPLAKDAALKSRVEELLKRVGR